MAEGARVMSLRDGTSKMSKSAESDMTRINLTDDADLIAKKIKKAKTDAGTVPANADEFEGRPEAKNLMSIYSLLSGDSMDSLFTQYGGQGFGDFKKALVDVAVAHMEPITTRMNELLSDQSQIDQILAQGGEKCNEIAQPFLNKTMDIMGFWKG
jgi:tryptophanyl-tRNA synthetase